MADEED